MAQSPAITAAVNAAVGAVVDTAAKNTNNIPSKSVDDAKPELGRAIEKAISAVPEVQFVTNIEPFWKKRSFWGAVGAGFSLVAAVGSALLTYMQAHTADSGAITASLTGAAFAAWGGYSSWKAGHSTTPLWTAKPEPYPLNRG